MAAPHPTSAPVAPLERTSRGPLASLRKLGSALGDGLHWIATHDAEIRDFFAASQARAKDPAWKYLLDRAPSIVSVGVVVGLELGARAGMSADDTVGELLEGGLTNPQLIEEVSDAVDRAELSFEQKEQLQRAVGDLSQSAHHLAVPLFINTLEGIFWKAAAQRGLIERDRKSKWRATALTGHPDKKISGVESLFGYDELGIDEPFESFLRGLVYGGAGNPYRHGTPTDGWRLRSLCLFVALIGWIEAEGLIHGKPAMRKAFMTRERSQTQNGAD